MSSGRSHVRTISYGPRMLSAVSTVERWIEPFVITLIQQTYFCVSRVVDDVRTIEQLRRMQRRGLVVLVAAG